MQGNSMTAVNLITFAETSMNDPHCVANYSQDVVAGLFMSNQSNLLFTCLIPRPHAAFHHLQYQLQSMENSVGHGNEATFHRK